MGRLFKEKNIIWAIDEGKDSDFNKTIFCKTRPSNIRNCLVNIIKIRGILKK
jgi:hypothetical protein